MECKLTELKRESVKEIKILVGYDVTCPKCKSKNFFETELIGYCSSVFCPFCRCKIDKTEFIK